ncbi:MAG: hypothetical protein JWP91_1300 [Fibrobacteres bacterium]|nr:hypothetical protein [Fibrobacterota bacterium]
MGRFKASAGVTIAVGVGAWMVQGCLGIGEDGGKRGVLVKPQLVRAEGKAASHAAVSVGSAAAKKSASPGATLDPDLHWSSQVAITSLKVPIKQISLHNAAFDHEADIYICSGSNDACQVEMAGTAFQDALNATPRRVEMGEYNYVFVRTCDDSEGSYHSTVTGSVNLDGKTWTTNTASVLDTVGPATPVSIRSDGCGRTYPLPHPLRITDTLGAEVDFKLYFDIEELAYAALGSRKTSGAWTPGNCSGDRPAETDAPSPPFLCIGYPDISGIIDAAPAVLERYRINGGATMGLFFTADDLAIGGYTRRFFTEGVDANTGFQAIMPLRNVSKNPDGTLYVDGYGPPPNAYDLDKSVFRVPVFQRADHSGSFSATAEGTMETTSHPYEAVRLTH